MPPADVLQIPLLSKKVLENRAGLQNKQPSKRDACKQGELLTNQLIKYGKRDDRDQLAKSKKNKLLKNA